jgi:outer membrane protein
MAVRLSAIVRVTGRQLAGYSAAGRWTRGLVRQETGVQRQIFTLRRLSMAHKLIGMLILLTLAIPGMSLANQKMSVGVGIGMAPDYEGSEDYTAVPLLMLRAKDESGRFVEFTGKILRLNVLPSKTASLGPVLHYRMERDDVDNDNVDALKQVDAALEGGIFARISYRSIQFGLQWLCDLSDGHDGYLTTPSLGYRWQVDEKLTILPTVSATYASKEYMQSYFGIDARNRGTNTVYPDYRAGAGWKDAGVNLTITYQLNDNWGTTALASYSRLLNDAKNSPLVDVDGRADQLFGGLLLTYEFH